LVDPRERSVAIAAEKIEWSPAKPFGDRAKRAVEEPPHVVDELLPAAHWHVARWSIGMKPGKALGPGARDLPGLIDDRGALFLALAPSRALFGLDGRDQ
jgi:hypothetical protein